MREGRGYARSSMAAATDLDQTVAMDAKHREGERDGLPDVLERAFNLNFCDQLLLILLRVLKQAACLREDPWSHGNQINDPNHAGRKPNLGDLKKARTLESHAFRKTHNDQVGACSHHCQQATENRAVAQGNQKCRRRESSRSGPVSSDGREKCDDRRVVEKPGDDKAKNAEPCHPISKSCVHSECPGCECFRKLAALDRVHNHEKKSNRQHSTVGESRNGIFGVNNSCIPNHAESHESSHLWSLPSCDKCHK
mmetsp:Transcript_48304/g.114511  ORF Transcript_48304/g.114511 Transcript_48304/m.114511 type:complete len:253 (+) Transcript_48304:460-1218(+)